MEPGHPVPAASKSGREQGGGGPHGYPRVQEYSADNTKGR
jgi:hypothetical protein